jgi:ribonucleoside-diphosphate reductase alpha chain
LSTQTQPVAGHAHAPISDIDPALFTSYRVRSRDGALRPFDPERIARALAKAMLAAHGGEHLSARSRDLCTLLTRQVCDQLRGRRPEGGAFDVEEVQDQAELAMMRAGEHDAARRFVLYREARRQAREAQGPKAKPEAEADPAITVSFPDGSKRPLDVGRLERVITEACTGLEGVSATLLKKDTLSSAFDGIPYAELGQALVLAARMRIEEEPNYTYAAARLLLDNVREQAVGKACTQAELQDTWGEYFASYSQQGVDYGIIDKELARYDL